MVHSRIVSDLRGVCNGGSDRPCYSLKQQLHSRQPLLVDSCTSRHQRDTSFVVHYIEFEITEIDIFQAHGCMHINRIQQNLHHRFIRKLDGLSSSEIQIASVCTIGSGEIKVHVMDTKPHDQHINVVSVNIFQ